MIFKLDKSEISNFPLLLTHELRDTPQQHFLVVGVSVTIYIGQY